MRPISLHSHPLELVRRIRAAQRQHAEAREASKHYAKLLWAYRSAGMKPAPDSTIALAYSNARSRMSNAAHLLRRLQAKHKTKYGHTWALRRRDMRTGKSVGRYRTDKVI